MDEFTYGRGGQTGSCRADRMQRLGENLIAYIRSRTAEHWIMFVAGLALGLLLG